MINNIHETLEVNPDPKRMIEGLRDTGYSFEAAVADIVDNSIAADAKDIKIWIQMDYDGEITLKITDNGIGMVRNELINAMKYGSAPRPNPLSLGKFGFGLKTASTAFCRRLSVISRSLENEDILKTTWDLDHVADVGKWELILERPTQDEINLLFPDNNNGSGTLVKWEHVDRLLKEYADPTGQHARRAMEKRINSLREHLAMVYQRYLDPGDTRVYRKISIWLNDEIINPWDPFCISESEKVLETEKPVGYEGDENDILGRFISRAYILPRKEEFSSPEAASEAKLSNDRQGIYIYRENRLIHAADWLGMYVQEPHFTLLRVEFSFGAELDEAFNIDIKKSSISLNSSLNRWLKEEFLPPPRRAAEDRYRRGIKIKERDKTKGAHGPSNVAIGNKEKEIDQAKIVVTDPEKQEVLIDNRYGKTRLILKIDHVGDSGELFVKPVDSIQDGLLWEPVLIDGNQGIHLNTSHEFYRKVYLPEIMAVPLSVATVQGIDALLWALGVAELKAVSEQTRNLFNDLRYDISRSLRKLVEHLPEPPAPED